MINKYIGFIIGGGLLLIILYIIGINEILLVLKEANIFYILLAIFMQIIVFIVMGIRWKCVIKALGYNAKFINIFLNVLLGQFFNNITPSMRGGGEVFRAYYLSKLEQIPKGICYSSVFIERFLDTLIYIIATFFVILYFIMLGFSYKGVLIFAWISLLIISLGVLYIFINRKLLEKITIKTYRFICKYLPYEYNEEKIIKIIDEFYRGILFFKGNKNNIYTKLSFIFSLLWIVVDITKYYIFFLALYYSVNIFVVAVVYLLALLSGVFSITPSGLGSADAITIGVFTMFNVPVSIAGAVNILDRFISYLFPTVLGYLSYIYIKRKVEIWR